MTTVVWYYVVLLCLACYGLGTLVGYRTGRRDAIKDMEMENDNAG